MLKTKALLVALAGILVISACQSAPLQTQSSSTATATLAASVSPSQGETNAPTANTGTLVAPTTAFTSSPAATCQVVQAVPDPHPEVAAAIDSDTASYRSMGPADAPIVLDVFSDFQCPFCANFSTVMDELVQQNPKDIRVVFHYLPLVSIHDKALLAAQAAEAAGRQGYFWAMHDVLFANQSQWQSMSSADFTTWLKDQAASLGLNSSRFTADLTSDDVIKAVNDSLSIAQSSTLKIDATPSVIINRLIRSPRNDVTTITNYMNFVKLGSKADKACPAMTVDPNKQYTATLKTEKGDVVIGLYADKAPWAVNSFIHLAQSGWYNGSGFFRVISGYIAQAGDPSNTGLGNPGYQFSNEVTPDLRFDKPGVVGMANAGADTNGSQFFITYAPIPDLDGKYTIFGEVLSGMDVLQTMRPRDPDNDALLFAPDPILSITIEEK